MWPFTGLKGQAFLTPKRSKTTPLLGPILLTIPLQLLAHDLAGFKGNDMDQPRNLAKRIRVE